MTKRRALISIPSPTTTVSRSLKRAAPSITRTPRPVKRSFESFGAIAAMTSCTCWWTLPKSTSGVAADTPKARACAMARACLAAAISDFEGTQPVLRHSPPILPFSTSTTDTPKAAAAAATERPPEPAPMTQISGVKHSAMLSPRARERDRERFNPTDSVTRERARSRFTTTGTSARTPSAASAASSSGVSGGMHVKFEPAIGAPGREAGSVGGLLRDDHAVEAGADEGEDEGRGNDAERGRRGEGREPDAEQRRNEIDEPERKDRHQPQEQQIAESVGAKTARASPPTDPPGAPAARRARSWRSERCKSPRSSRPPSPPRRRERRRTECRRSP